MTQNNQKHRPNGAAAEGGRPIGAPPKAAPVFLIILYHKYSWIFLIYSLYMPYKYFLIMFHIFSLVCFLISGVKRRQVLIAKPCFYFLFSDFTPFIILLAILWSFIKKSALHPKCTKLNQNSDYGHVRTYSWLHKLRNTRENMWNIFRKHIWNT